MLEGLEWGPKLCGGGGGRSLAAWFGLRKKPMFGTGYLPLSPLSKAPWRIINKNYPEWLVNWFTARSQEVIGYTLKHTIVL